MRNFLDQLAAHSKRTAAVNKPAKLCKFRFLRLAAFRTERSIGQSWFTSSAAICAIVRFILMI
jgi:hypothetical protein